MLVSFFTSVLRFHDFVCEIRIHKSLFRADNLSYFEECVELLFRDIFWKMLTYRGKCVTFKTTTKPDSLYIFAFIIHLC